MAVSKLYFLSYKNYYNKQTFKLDTIADYAGYVLATQSTANFNPNDGVDTTFIANFADNLHPDYMVETQTTGEGEEAVESIVSRWYIIDAPRARQGQYRLTLHRDIPADYADALADATCYIEKGWVADDNPLIFNAENGRYNQIKVSEIKISDKSEGPYIVAYLAKSFFDDVPAGDNYIDINISKENDINYDEEQDSTAALLAAYPNSSLSNNQQSYNYIEQIDGYEFYVNASSADLPAYKAVIWKNFGGAVRPVISDGKFTTTPLYFVGPYSQLTEREFVQKCQNVANYMRNEESPAIADITYMLNNDLYPNNVSRYNSLRNANGRIVRVGTTAPYDYYQLSVTVVRSENKAKSWITSTSAPTVKAEFSSFIENMKLQNLIKVAGTMNNTTATYTTYTWTYKAVWTKINQSYNLQIPKHAPTLKDAPYYMMVMPYKDNIDFKNTLGSQWRSEGNVEKIVANYLIKNYGSNIYDIQVLPYFPTQSLVNGSSGIVDFTGQSLERYVPIRIVNPDETYTTASFAWFCEQSAFSFNIQQTITINDPKIENETTICRMQSPNFASSFDFSLAKNNGLTGWAVDCKYAPFTPYIHIAPFWGGIYAQNPQLTRGWRNPYGLICSGDFSIDIISDAWTEYKLNNKNYQLAFDREIKSIDLSQNIQRSNIALKAIPSILGSGIAGAMSGGLVGGIAGTIGGTASVIGSGLMTEATLADQKSAKIDQFNYLLGNIQAQPDTLQKVTTINQNNKLIPFYEIYTCTEVEKTALQNAITYGGMQIGVIGKIPNYCMAHGETYIKGKIVRIDIGDDTHLARTLSDELNNGLYFTKE